MIRRLLDVALRGLDRLRAVLVRWRSRMGGDEDRYFALYPLSEDGQREFLDALGERLRPILRQWRDQQLDQRADVVSDLASRHGAESALRQLPDQEGPEGKPVTQLATGKRQDG